MRITLGLMVLALAAGSAQGALFSDDFNTNSSANWNVLASSADTEATFAYDYSAMGIPAAPNGTGTVGLKLRANMAGVTNDAITLTPKNQSFSGDYKVSFDMWINYNGKMDGGGTGSTQFLTAGVGHDNATVLSLAGTSTPTGAGKGGWFAVNGDGGTNHDFRAYKNSTFQWPGSAQYAAGTHATATAESDPYYASFGGVAAPAAQLALYPEQTGNTLTGAVGMAWHRVTIDVSGTTARWSIGGKTIATLSNAVDLATGNISIGYSDMNTGASGNPALSFGLIDNLVVTPEPTSLALLALGGLALLRRRA